jgi:subtilase family serine protease
MKSMKKADNPTCPKTLTLQGISMKDKTSHCRSAGTGNNYFKFSAAFVAALSALVATGWTSGAQAQVYSEGNVHYKPVCAPASENSARCTSYVITDSKGRLIESSKPPIAGFTPAQLRDAYKIKAEGNASTVIAIVDAFGYDNAESDLATYRSQFGLPPCTTDNGCFKKLNQEGQEGNYPAQNIGWAQESALDLDMASAMCPNCTIYLIEANNNGGRSLARTANEAAALGAHVISNSYCGKELHRTRALLQYYHHQGVAVTASAGDDKYGVCTPASMPAVVAVGGTFLVTAQNDRGWNETVWSGTGSGCSRLFRKPDWQTDTGCPNRTVGDVAAVASPSSPVAVYGPNSAGNSTWLTFGGTSVAAPLIGGIFGANGGKVKAASTLYAHTDKLFDVTQGNNGSCSPAYLCTGEVGYDGPTGNGTPNGADAFGKR